MTRITRAFAAAGTAAFCVALISIAPSAASAACSGANITGNGASTEAIAQAVRELAHRAREAMGAAEAELRVVYELRYRGQSFELPIPLAGFADFTADLTILDTFSSAFATYGLSTAIGPVTGGAVFNSGTGFATTAGTLIIGSISGDATFTATIPEPATWAMMALGFAALGLAGYARGGRFA